MISARVLDVNNSASILFTFIGQLYHKVEQNKTSPKWLIFQDKSKRLNVSSILFAKKLGISQAHLSQIEKGVKSVSPKRAKKFAKIFWLFRSHIC
jgi:DNA-binding XRE family transcriptional regulator